MAITGRPAFFDDEKKRSDFLTVLASGCSRHDAAKYVGADYATVFRTMKRDPTFAKGVDEAETKAKVGLLVQISRASKDDWRAAAWIMERKYWQEFAKRSPGQITPEMLATTLNKLVGNILEALPVRYHIRIRNAVDDQLQALSLELQSGAKT